MYIKLHLCFMVSPPINNFMGQLGDVSFPNWTSMYKLYGILNCMISFFLWMKSDSHAFVNQVMDVMDANYV